MNIAITLSSLASRLVKGTVMRARVYLVYVSSDVFVLDDDEQTALCVLLLQEGDGALFHVALLQEVLLQTEAQAARLRQNSR